jgi:hypothetical protein
MNRLKKRDTPARLERPGAATTGRGDRAVHDALTNNHIESLLDEGLAETFPASDPVAVTWPGRSGPGGV